MSKASDKRFESIKVVSNQTVETSVNGNTFLASREQIATWIRELAPLGRTERWAVAVENWAVLVETEESLEWAFLQGSIWASYAV